MLYEAESGATDDWHVGSESGWVGVRCTEKDDEMRKKIREKDKTGGSPVVE